jgi:hypothetical protein
MLCLILSTIFWWRLFVTGGERMMIPRGWEFYHAARGYKDEPEKAGSTRIVWYWKTGDLYIVMKLFQDDDGSIRKYPRTIKFWHTPDFRHDKMKWASAANEFQPSDSEYKAYVAMLRGILSEVERSLQ